MLFNEETGKDPHAHMQACMLIAARGFVVQRMGGKGSVQNLSMFLCSHNSFMRMLTVTIIMR